MECSYRNCSPQSCLKNVSIEIAMQFLFHSIVEREISILGNEFQSLGSLQK